MSNAGNPWPWVLGREAPPQEEELSAGPLTATLAGLDLLNVRIGGVEVMRRLGIRVRDAAWGTIAPATSTVEVERTPDGFAINMRAHHVGPGIDFAWSGRIAADGKGSLSFTMDGEAIADCTYNRIGLIVLHPLTLSDASIAAGHGNGALPVTVPKLVEPVFVSNGIEAPLIPAFDRLSVRHREGIATTFLFEGDLFETEDQRNWTDGSLKTFSTPLSVPVPLKLARGHSLRQTLHFEWQGSAAAPAIAAPDTVMLAIGDMTSRLLPSIGLSIDADGHLPAGDELVVLRSMKPSHVRAEVDLTETTAHALARLNRCREIAEKVGVPIDLALRLPTGAPDIGQQLEGVASAVSALAPVRLALLPSGDAVTPPAWLQQAETILASHRPIPLVAGTRSDFLELNRQRPPDSFAGELTYAASSEVHDTDEVAILQSLEGQLATVATARAFAPAARINVGPITLRPWPRSDLDAPGDERQASLFAAAWLAASVAQLARAGAHTLTYFECTGPRGVISRRRDGAEAAPYPTFHVLSYLSRHASMPLVECASSDPARAYALCFVRDGGHDVLIASLSARRQSVAIGGLSAARYRLSTLTPSGFEDGAIVDGESATLELGPYSVAALTPDR